MICNTAVCDQPIATGRSGSARFLTPNDGFGLVADGNTGTFYTDAQGKRLVSKREAGAVQQYVKPAACLSPRPGHYFGITRGGDPSYSRLRARIGSTLGAQRGHGAALRFALGNR